MGLLTTHVLDTAQGKPAAGIPLTLYRIESTRTQVKKSITNLDGRTDAPLLNKEAFSAGTWELVFDVAAYFSDSSLEMDSPPFLDQICLRFTTSRDDHYHVPLLVSPWSYSTYRGS